MNEFPTHPEENPVRPDAEERPPAVDVPPCCDPAMPAFQETPGEESALVRDFLKREFFYIVVVFLVMLTGLFQTWRAYKTREPASSVEPILVGELDTRVAEKIEVLKEANHPVALVATGVGLLRSTLFWAGIAIAVLVLALWIARGCILAPIPSNASPWGLWDVLKVAALFAGGGALLMAILRANDIQAFASSRTPTASILASLLLIGAAIVVIREEHRASLADIGIRRDGFVRGVILGLIAFVLLQPILHGLATLHAKAADSFPPTLQRSAHELLVTPSGPAFLLGIFAAVVIAPVTEEILFRGLLLPALRRWMRPLAAVWLSAAFFGAAHASEADVFVLVPMFVMGVVLGYLYDRTRTLAASLTAHITYNALVVLNLMTCRFVLMAEVS